LILDPNFAELAAVGQFESSVRKLPWANANAPWKACDFGRESNFNPARLIAEFAIKRGVDAVLCTDTSCCPRREDQIEHSDAHMLTRRSRQLEDLSRVPEFRRAENLLLHLIDPAVRSARQIALLKLLDENVAKVVKVAKKRLITLRDALGDLQATESVPTRSGPLTFRGGSSSINAVIGR
jgi:hypothetical protein